MSLIQSHASSANVPGPTLVTCSDAMRQVKKLKRKPTARMLQRRERALHTVYAIADPRDSRIVYVGETRNFSERKRRHRKSARTDPMEAIAVELAIVEASLAKCPTAPLADHRRSEHRRLSKLADMTSAARAKASRACQSKMPTSVKVWLACLGEADREPVFVVLDKAKGEVRSRLKETVWVHRFARAGMKLHNKTHDQNCHLKALREAHERSGNRQPFDERAALETLLARAETPSDSPA